MQIELHMDDDKILQVTASGKLDAEVWRDYKAKIYEYLEGSEEKVYILTDLSKVEGIDPNILGEFGHAPHLVHPKLGFIVLLGGTSFQQFITKITEGNALRAQRAEKLRVHYEREIATEWLLARRELDQALL